MEADSGILAAHWPASRALPLACVKLPPGYSAASLELDPSDGGADSKSSCSGKKRRAGGFPRLLPVPGIRVPHLLTSRWEELQVTVPRSPHGTEKGPRLSQPSGLSHCHTPAPTPHSPEKGTHLKETVHIFRQMKGSPVCWQRES